MKKILYTILIASGLTAFLGSCSSGDYNANPASNANASVNPLAPLDSAQFNWVSSGQKPMSASVNGGGWAAIKDSLGTNYFFNDSTGANVVFGFSGKTELFFSLVNVYAVNIYQLTKQVTINYAIYCDSVGSADSSHYYYSTLGNSGEIQILENDLLRMQALFYFQAINNKGTVINVTNGYFNVNKS